MELYPLLVPAGSDTEVQYNDGNLFGADSTFTFNDVTKVLTTTGLTVTGSSVHALNSAVFQPTTDQTDFFKIMDADGGTAIFQVDTVNEVIGIKTAPDANIDIKLAATHSSAAANQVGLEGIITQDTATANAIIGMRGGAISTHTAGTIGRITGFEVVCSPQSNFPVTNAYGALLGVGVLEGSTPAITVMAGSTSVNSVATSATTFALNYFSQTALKSTGTCGVAIGFADLGQTIGSTQNLSFLSGGDSLIASDKKLYFEGGLGVTGDTYITYDSAGATLDFFVNATEVLNSSSTKMEFPVDLVSTGGGGLPFGSCWGNEIGWTQASAAQNTWYEISDADMSDGQLHNVAHDGSGKLTVTYAGMYLCTWTLSGETDAGAGTHIQATFSVSGTETNDGMNHSETRGANAQIAMAGTAILDLAASATLEVSIRTTDAGTPDVSVDHLNIDCVQVGGT